MAESHGLTVVNYEQDVPEWIRLTVNKMIETFRLYDWIIHVRMKDNPGGRDEAGGFCAPNTRYKKVWIEISRDATDTPAWRSNVVHEALHIVTAELKRTVDHILDMVPEASREVLTQMFMDQLEQQVEMLARGLVGLPIWEGPQKEDDLDTILPG
jgi:hypothetical protein